MRKIKLWLRGMLALLIILLPAILITLLWSWDSPLYKVQHNLTGGRTALLVAAVLASFLAGFWFVRGYD